MKYLIYLQPSEEVHDLVQSLRERVHHAITNGSANDTHCTIGLLRTSDSEEHNILQSLEHVLTPPLSCTTEHADIFTPETLVVRLRKSAAIEALHYEILDALSTIPRQDEPLTGGPFPADAEMAHRLYGSPFFGPCYNPHLSVARINPARLHPLPDVETRTWTADEFVIAKKDSGTWKELKRYSLH